MCQLTLPRRKIERGRRPGRWTKTTNWSPRILRRRLRSSYSGPCFAGERTFSPSGSRAKEPEGPVIHQLAQTNGFGASVRSLESGVPIVQTGVLFQSPMRSFDGIFQDEIVKAGISSWAFIPCFTTRHVISLRPISTRRAGAKTRVLSSTHAADSPYRPPWSGRAPGTAATSGSSLKMPFLRALRAN